MPDPQVHKYVLPSGAKIEIQNLPEIHRGPRDVPKDAEAKETPLENVISPLGEICELIFENLKASIKTPETVKIELNASLKGKTSFVLVSGETPGTLKITVTWKNSS